MHFPFVFRDSATQEGRESVELGLGRDVACCLISVDTLEYDPWLICLETGKYHVMKEAVHLHWLMILHEFSQPYKGNCPDGVGLLTQVRIPR